MPHNIIRQAYNLITRSLGHLRKSFRFSLVLECIAREINALSFQLALSVYPRIRNLSAEPTRSVNVGFDQNVNTADPI